MATLNTIYDIRHGRTDIRNRVVCGLAIAAHTVINEDAQTPNHAARALWAKDVIADSNKWIDLFMWAVALTPAVGEAVEANTIPSDEALLAIVLGNIDKAIGLVS